MLSFLRLSRLNSLLLITHINDKPLDYGIIDGQEFTIYTIAAK